METGAGMVPRFGKQQPCGATNPAETSPRAWEIPNGHFNGEASKGQPPVPSQEIEVTAGDVMASSPRRALMGHWGSWPAFWCVFVPGERERELGCGEDACEGEAMACPRPGAGCHRLPDFNYFALFEPISGD